MRALILAATLVSLTGCALHEQAVNDQFSAIGEKMQSRKAGYELTLRDPALDPIRHTLVDWRQTQLAPSDCEDAAFPSAAEQGAIKRWADLRHSYLRDSLALLQVSEELYDFEAARFSDYKAALGNAADREYLLTISLSEGRMTNCEFLARRAELALGFNRAVRATQMALNEHRVKSARLLANYPIPGYQH